MSHDVLTIRVETDDEFHDRVLEDLEAVEAGEDLDDTHELSLPSERALSRVLSEKNLELIRAIAKHEPESIREAARLVERDIKEVHQNVSELETYGLIEFQENGQAKQPVVWYDEIEITFSVRSPAQDGEPASA